MMIPTIANPVIQDAVSNFMIKENYEEAQTAYDTDDVVYRVSGNADEKVILFSYQGNDTKIIMEKGGQEMLDEIYPDFQCDQAKYNSQDFHLTLRIEGGNLPKTTKISKKMDEETQEKLRDENENIRAQRKAIVDPIAEKIAKFKMNFLSAPIRRAMKSAMAQKQLEPVEVAYRGSEKYWVMMPEKNAVHVFFAVHFTTDVDKSLARTMLLEWGDSMRKIHAPPLVKFHDLECPPELKQAFPKIDMSKYSNSMISFKVTEHLHLKGKDLEQSLSFFVGFRNFMNYHLHAIKQSLHARMRKRVETFERVLMMAKRDKEGPKNWKETHGGIQESDRDLKEEKKVEEVFVHKK